MLTDVGRRDQNLSERDGIVGQKVKLEIVLGVGIGVNDASDIDDEADSLQLILAEDDFRLHEMHTSLAT